MAITKWGASDIFASTTTNNARGDAKVVGLKDGTFLVVWADGSGAFGSPGWNIRGQILHADGTKKGGEFLVNGVVIGGVLDTSGEQTEPDVTVLSNGRFIVTYTNSSKVGTSGVSARIYNADGTPVSDSEFSIKAESGADSGGNASISALSNGGFVVSYTSPDGSANGIRAQAFDTDGKPVGGEVPVNTTTANSQRESAVVGLTGDATGKYAVFYFDTSLSPDDPNPTVRGRIFNADGSQAVAEFLVPSSRLSKGPPKVTALTNGKFVVVWEHESPESGDGSETSIKGQIFNADGTKFRGEFLVNSMTDRHQDSPSVVALPNGGFAVSYTNGWYDKFGPGSYFDSYGVAMFNSNGDRIGDDYYQTRATGSLSSPDLTSSLGVLEDGRLVLTWAEIGSSSHDIRARILEPRDKGVTLVGKGMDDEYYGTKFADSLSGKIGADRLSGDAGDDTLIGGAGADTLDGGAGIDTASYADASAAVIASLATPIGNSGDADGDIYISIENLTGSAFDDQLTGDDKDNVLDGSGGNDVLAGGKGNDVLIGGDSTLSGAVNNDTLDGGIGADTLVGGKGNDTYYVDNAGDKVVEAVGGGKDIVITSISYALDADAEVEELRAASGSASINLTGNGIANKLIGNDAANELNGGAGADYMDGGAGDDTYVIDDAGDTVVEAAGDDNGFDTIVIGKDFAVTHEYNLTAFANVEALKALDSAGNVTLIGNGIANVITGNNGDNTLDGGDTKAIDTLEGGKGNDTYVIRHQGDVIIEKAGEGTDTADVRISNFTLDDDLSIEILRAAAGSGIASYTLKGNNLANTIIGSTGKDVLDGGGSADDPADRLDGGGGDDLYQVRHKNDVVVEASDAGNDKIVAYISYTLKDGVAVETLAAAAGIENLILTGNKSDNFIQGNDLANTLDGGLGADVLDGGAGDDTYYIDNPSDLVIEGAVTGGISRDVIVITAGIDYVLDNSVYVEELRIKEGIDLVSLTGNARANTLIGNSSANTLDGGGGGDALQGGGGDDTYIVRTGDQVFEALGQGIDTIKARSSFILAEGSEIEILQADSASGLKLTGNSLANTIIGNDGNDTLDSGGGSDTLRGGNGDDIYIINALGAVIQEDAGPQSGTDTAIVSINYDLSRNPLANVEIIQAKAGTDAINLTGDSGANTLIGNAGDNILDGGAGADKLVGGAGNDTYYVDDQNDQIVEAAGEGTDTIVALISYTLGSGAEIEILRAGGIKEPINLTGSASANTLIGNEGDNILDGGAGADVLQGNAGNDTYIVDNVSDTIIERSGGGYDTVRTSVSFSIVSTEVEYLEATGTAALTLVGNALNNQIVGNDSGNTLDGGAGSDWLVGGIGNDTYYVDHLLDQVADAGGIDKVISSVSYNLGASVENLIGADGTSKLALTGNTLNNMIRGNAGDNALKGLAGKDILYGGLGKDTLYGGKHKDAFAFDTKLGKKNIDKIADFSVKDDSIWLDNAIFKKLGKKGTAIKPAKMNKNFFVNGDKAHDKDDYVIYDNKKGVLYYDADGSGGGAAIKFATIKKGLKMTAADFFVI
ncbi:beta strand repeat-containing protein [Microvirga sp. 2TAF3]|uniref:beta strand repeat-containing protein n=1 Tax=Microvirga sp. 2TAF3 TaxID=3233014 RepID=UPI003F9C6962